MAALLRSASILGLACILASCGGAGGGSSPLPKGPVAGQSGSAAISFFVPSAPAPASKRRDTLPSNAQSVVVAVANADGSPMSPPVTPVIANISPTAPGCSSVAGGLSCTVSISVPLGSYVFFAASFSAPNGGGNVLTEGECAATIGSGPNSVNITLSGVSVYAALGLSGNFALVTIDHGANTLTVVDPTSGYTTSATVAYLPNGDLKLVVTSSTDPSQLIGEINYARELPGVAFTYESTKSTTVNPTGQSTTNGDWGVGTALAGCPTQGSTTTLNLAAIAGPAFGTNESANFAFLNGTATIGVSGGTATANFNGEGYNLSGTALASQTGSQTCSSGIFSATNQGGVAFSPLGVVIVGGGNGTGVSPTDTQVGGVGFTVQPGATLDLAALTSATYDGFLGEYGAANQTSLKGGTPLVASPAGADTLQACFYTNFETNVVGTTSCATITFATTQPFPGVLLGTVTPASAATQPFVATASLINGKYVIFGLSGAVAGGTAPNFALIQH